MELVERGGHRYGVYFFFFSFMILYIFFNGGNRSKREEPQVGKVSVFKSQVGNL